MLFYMVKLKETYNKINLQFNLSEVEEAAWVSMNELYNAIVK